MCASPRPSSPDCKRHDDAPLSTPENGPLCSNVTPDAWRITAQNKKALTSARASVQQRDTVQLVA